MRNFFETGKSRAAGVAGLSLALLLTGCSSASQEISNRESQVGYPASTELPGVKIEKQFTPDGVMITSVVSTAPDGRGSWTSDMTFSWCEQNGRGYDVVEVSSYPDDGNRQRTPNYAPCDDGRLTASDYQPPR